MNPSTQAFECEICGSEFPDIFKHEHHVIQQAAGGTNLPTISLCSACHDTVHLLAHELMHPKGNMETILLTQYRGDETASQKAAHVAQMAFQSMLRKREGDPDFQPEEGVLSVSVPMHVKTRFQMIARDSGMSMESLLYNLVLTTVERGSQCT